MTLDRLPLVPTTYSPYGDFLALHGDAVPVGTPYRITGQRQEADIGLYYYRSR